jgi:Saccharopine dehydrogenase NADP binding domain
VVSPGRPAGPVVVLGGTGRTGRRAAETVLREMPGCTVRVVGRDRERAAVAARALGPRAEPAVGDLADPVSLGPALRDAALVVNAAGPFFRHGTAALGAAVRHGCHYVDVCDDWEPLEPLLDLDGAARAAGVVAVLGAGLAPGLTSLLAVRALDAVHAPDHLVVGFALDGTGEPAAAGPGTVGPSPLTVHLMHCVTGTIRHRRDGRLVDDAPRVPVQLEPLLAGPAHGSWTVGSPEALAVSRRLRDVPRADCVAVGPRVVLDRLRELAEAVDEGVVGVDDAASAIENGGPTLPRWTGPTLFALVRGHDQDRHPVTASAAVHGVPGHDITYAGVVAGTVAAQILRGGISRAGVAMAEDVVDPDTVLAPGNGQHARPAVTVRRTRSPG